MRLRKLFPLLVVMLTLLFISCGLVQEEEEPDLSTIHGLDGNFQVLRMFEYNPNPVLDDWWDTIDGDVVNDLQNRTIEENRPDFIRFSHAMSELMGGYETFDAMGLPITAYPLAELLGDDLANLMRDLIKDVDTSFYKRPVGSSESNNVPGFYNQIREGVDENGKIRTYDPADNDYGKYYSNGLYSFMDKLTEGDYTAGGKQILDIQYKLMNYLVDTKTKSELLEDMDELIDDLTDEDFRDDFIDVSHVLGKMHLAADYPVYIDEDGRVLKRDEIDVTQHKNLGFGNLVNGTNSLMKWLNMMLADKNVREDVKDLIREIASVFKPENSEKNKEALKALIINLEDYFTEQGSGHYNGSDYYKDNDEVFVDAELGEIIKTLLVSTTGGIMVRSDRENSFAVPDPDGTWFYHLRKILDTAKAFGVTADSLKERDRNGRLWMERSLENHIKYDLQGRDRTDPASGAAAASHLESVMVDVALPGNVGWQRPSGPTGESGNDTEELKYGHGEMTGMTTLNDILFDFTPLPLELGPLHIQSAFNLLFKDTAEWSRAENLFRSAFPFTIRDRVGNNFYFDLNYGANQFLAPPCLGDYGSPYGGRAVFVRDTEPGYSALTYPEYYEVEDPVQGGHIKIKRNGYDGYDPTGMGAKQHIDAFYAYHCVRQTFEGEGPYYYAPENAEIVLIEGRPHYTYYRPSGRIYAYVNKTDPDNWEYIYPIGDERVDKPDYDAPMYMLNGKMVYQRYNRYRSEWKSDYYLISLPGARGSYNHYIPDNSDGQLKVIKQTDENAEAGRLIYSEVIKENDPRRACQSAQEAFFRNHQFFANEKKMVFILPMIAQMSMEELGLGLKGLRIVGFQVLEMHGLQGLSTTRIAAGNHEWAIAGGSDPDNATPADYRCGLVLTFNTADVSQFIGFRDDGALGRVIEGIVDRAMGIIPGETMDSLFYGLTLGKGLGVSSVISHNSSAVTRLAFPVSPYMERREGVWSNNLGSQEFEVGDDIWRNRSVLAPVLHALGAKDRNRENANYDNFAPNVCKVRPDDPLCDNLTTPIRNMSTLMSNLLTPWFYYQKDQGTPPYKTWKMRVAGDDPDRFGVTPPAGSTYQGDAYLMSAHEFYHDLSNGEYPPYNGSEAERKWYQPQPLKNILNILWDSDIADVEKRMDGLMPLILQTDALSKLFSVLLSDRNNSDLLYVNLEEMAGALRFTKPVQAKINGGEYVNQMGEDISSYKKIMHPDWMFVQGDIENGFTNHRDEDLILDYALDKLIGKDEVRDSEGNVLEEGYGLADYPEEQERLAAEGKEPWEDLYDAVDSMEKLLYPNKKYAITPSVIELLDEIFARPNLYTDQEIAGLVYATGKLFAKFDEGSREWTYQGEPGFSYIYNILAKRLPEIHAVLGKDGTGDTYMSALRYNKAMMKKDGLLDFIVSTTRNDNKWKDIIYDLSAFLGSDIVTDPQDVMWPTLSDLMIDFADTTEKSGDLSRDLDEIYRIYGFYD